MPSLRLHCLPELRSLYLQGNDITKVCMALIYPYFGSVDYWPALLDLMRAQLEGLERCIQLRELILDKNKVRLAAASFSQTLC